MSRANKQSEQGPQSASDLAHHFLARLNAADVEQAMVNAGYLENGITTVEFKRTYNSKGRARALYRTHFYDESEGAYSDGNVLVNWDPASSRYLAEPMGCSDSI
jgi:hypothetical protein